MLTSVIKRIRNSLRGPIKEKIFFLHIPKCGGNSIKDALKNRYTTLDPRRDRAFINLRSTVMHNVRKLLNEEESDDFRVTRDFTLRVPEYVLLYHMSQPQFRCIAGHIPFSRIAFRNFGDRYAFVTVLRDPVERYISEFYYNKYHSRATSNMDISQYLYTRFGQAQGTQYVLFLGGRSKGNDHYSNKAVKRALENLNCFSLIGFLENLNDFAESFHQRFGVKLNIGKKNVTPKAQDREKITSNIRREIETICERDLEIYHKALTQFQD